MASVVEILRWESSVIWGLWGNWFAEIEAGSLIRGDGPQSRVSLPTLSAAVLRIICQQQTSALQWAILGIFEDFLQGAWSLARRNARVCHNWSPGRWNVNVAADCPQCPQAGPHRSYRDIFTQFYTRLVSGVLSCDSSCHVTSCPGIDRAVQCYVYQDPLHFQVIGPLPWSGFRWFNNFSSLTHALCQRLFRNPHCDYKHFRRSQAYIGISVKLQTRSTSCYFNSPF